MGTAHQSTAVVVKSKMLWRRWLGDVFTGVGQNRFCIRARYGYGIVASSISIGNRIARFPVVKPLSVHNKFIHPLSWVQLEGLCPQTISLGHRLRCPIVKGSGNPDIGTMMRPHKGMLITRPRSTYSVQTGFRNLAIFFYKTSLSFAVEDIVYAAVVFAVGQQSQLGWCGPGFPCVGSLAR